MHVKPGSGADFDAGRKAPCSVEFKGVFLDETYQPENVDLTDGVTQE